MLDFYVTMQVSKGKYTYEEEYDLTEYSEEEIVEYMQNGINWKITDDGGEEISINISDLKIIDIDFPSSLYIDIDNMTLSELTELTLIYQDCNDDDEIEILIEFRDEIDNLGTIKECRESYMGHWDNFDDYAEYMFRECHDIPDELEGYIDWKQVSKDLKYDYTMTNSGYVFSK